MIELITRQRRRVAQAKILELEYRSGSKSILVNLHDESVTTIELCEEILEKSLIKLFEKEVYKKNPFEIAEKIISQHYSACTTRRLDKLSDFGREFIDSLISNLVEQAYADRGGE